MYLKNSWSLSIKSKIKKIKFSKPLRIIFAVLQKELDYLSIIKIKISRVHPSLKFMGLNLNIKLKCDGIYSCTLRITTSNCKHAESKHFHTCFDRDNELSSKINCCYTCKLTSIAMNSLNAFIGTEFPPVRSWYNIMGFRPLTDSYLFCSNKVTLI